MKKPFIYTEIKNLKEELKSENKQLTKEELEVKILNSFHDFLQERMDHEILRKMNERARVIIRKEESLGNIQYNRYNPVITLECKSNSVQILVVDMMQAAKEDKEFEKFLKEEKEIKEKFEED